MLQNPYDPPKVSSSRTRQPSSSFLSRRALTFICGIGLLFVGMVLVNVSQVLWVEGRRGWLIAWLDGIAYFAMFAGIFSVAVAPFIRRVSPSQQSSETGIGSRKSAIDKS